MKLMVCYDDTSEAKDAVRLAQKHAKDWNASIEVISTITREEPLRHSQLQRMEDKFDAQIQDLFEDARDIAYNAQLLVDSLTSGEQLVKFAARKLVDMMYIGIKKRSKVGKLLFGSTAQYIILNATCPVVTVNGLNVGI